MNPALPSHDPQILPPSSPELHEIDQEIRHGAKAYRAGLRIVMIFGWKLRLAERWEELGFANEDAYRFDLDIPTSTWYKYVNLGFELRHVQPDDLKQIRITNLELMTQIGPELWRDFPWVDEAKKLKPAEFAELIVERRQQNNDNSEPMTHVKWKVTFLSKQFLEGAVLDFQKLHNLSTPGRALELLIADRHDRPNVLAMLEQAQVLVGEAQVLMQRKGFNDSEIQAKLDSARSLLDADLAKAIYQARAIERNKGRGGRSTGASPQFGGTAGPPQ